MYAQYTILNEYWTKHRILKGPYLLRSQKSKFVVRGADATGGRTLQWKTAPPPPSAIMPTIVVIILVYIRTISL